MRDRPFSSARTLQSFSSPALSPSGQYGIATVTWNAVAGATDYRVTVGTSAGASDVGVFDTGSTAVAYDILLPPGTYYVSVAALVSGVWQTPSTPVILYV